ncbi:MAG: hypothetical protein NTV49_06455 [Kiritimatiellaeota bacterium]|nr:hypothetical protein [Kiritimatiellota bacterium]
MNENEINELREIYRAWSVERLAEVLEQRRMYSREAVGIALETLHARAAPEPLQALMAAVEQERRLGRAAPQAPVRKKPLATNLLLGLFGMVSAVAGVLSGLVLLVLAYRSIFVATDHADSFLGVVMMIGSLAVLWASYNFFLWSRGFFRAPAP